MALPYENDKNNSTKNVYQNPKQRESALKSKPNDSSSNRLYNLSNTHTHIQF